VASRLPRLIEPAAASYCVSSARTTAVASSDSCTCWSTSRPVTAASSSSALLGSSSPVAADTACTSASAAPGNLFSAR
jgi:hypothetical protein